jgi:uncharacterized membrane protein YhaH (DUF805 family)
MTSICSECACPYDGNLLCCPECGCPNPRIDDHKKAALRRQAMEELTELSQTKEQLAELEADAITAQDNHDTARSLLRSLKRVFVRCDNFTGRSRRSEFWTFIAFNVVVSVILYIILFSSIGRDYITISEANTDEEYWHRLIHSCLNDHLFITLLIIGYLLLILLPLLSVTVRRLHDTNRSGLWLLMAIVPFFVAKPLGISPYIGLLFLSIMLLLDSAPSNKYGKLLRINK